MSDLREVEIRFLVTRRLATLIDALMLADGLAARNDWVIPVLEAEANRRVHAATVLLRCAGINPLAADCDPLGAKS